MKLVAFRKKRVHEGAQLDKLQREALESLSRLSGVLQQAHSYTELRQQIHDDLRIQHPEWIQPNGECPMCDAYEARLMELLDPLTRNAGTETTAGPDPTLGHGLN